MEHQLASDISRVQCFNTQPGWNHYTVPWKTHFPSGFSDFKPLPDLSRPVKNFPLTQINDCHLKLTRMPTDERKRDPSAQPLLITVTSGWHVRQTIGRTIDDNSLPRVCVYLCVCVCWRKLPHKVAVTHSLLRPLPSADREQALLLAARHSLLRMARQQWWGRHRKRSVLSVSRAPARFLL